MQDPWTVGPRAGPLDCRAPCRTPGLSGPVPVQESGMGLSRVADAPG